MYECECAFERTPAGIIFLPDDAVSEDHPLRCELRATFRIASIYVPEADTGAGLDWDGDIAAIAWRTWGDDACTDSVTKIDGWRAQWREIRGSTFDAAKTFLLRRHGEALWQRADEHVEEVFYREVA